MRILRLSALLVAALPQASCQLAQAPLNMLQALGRTLHVGSPTPVKSPDDFRLESRDAHDALADGTKVDLKPQDARLELAQR